MEVFYTRRFEDLDAKTTLALAAADKAVTKAEIATEKRFEGVNEFRATLADQANRLMPREEAVSKFDNMQKDINSLSKEVTDRRTLLSDRAEDSSRLRQSWLIPVVVIGVLGVINLILNILPHITK